MSTNVVLAHTGEVLDVVQLDEITLVDRIAEVRRLQKALQEAVNALGDEVLRRMDVDARYSGRIGDYAVKGDGPGGMDYDGEALTQALRPFVEDGVISQAAVDAAVTERTVLKVNANGVRALLKRDDEISKVIRDIGQPKRRRVTVTDLSEQSDSRRAA